MLFYIFQLSPPRLSGAMRLCAAGNTVNPVRFSTVHSGWLSVGYEDKAGPRQLQMTLPLTEADPPPNGAGMDSPVLHVSGLCHSPLSCAKLAWILHAVGWLAVRTILTSQLQLTAE